MKKALPLKKWNFCSSINVAIKMKDFKGCGWNEYSFLSSMGMGIAVMKGDLIQ